MQSDALNLRKFRGKFIVLDGPDGAGKSTQMRLLAEQLGKAGVAHVTCRDPGGTRMGDRIRSLLLDQDNLKNMDPACETLLFMASRAQLVAEIIRPALARGDTVLCDRFVTATCAYQGAAGYDPQKVIGLADLAIGNCWPDVTVVLELSAEAGLSRRGAGRDAMESRSIDFHLAVSRIFKEVEGYYPTPVVYVKAEGSIDEVHRLIVGELDRVLS